MRKIELPLTHTQKLRLQKALTKLQSLSSTVSANAAVTVADPISVSVDKANVLKGHGIVERDEELVATQCGIVERVNSLLIIRPLRSRYKPETGDIIVGRVIEVAPKRWKIDINSNQDAVLMLSSVTLPDGIQRRRTHDDELNMRGIFEESDVVSAEVRNIQGDGTYQLQARSEKYGKLARGQLVTVPPYLVKRSKQHFHTPKSLEIEGVLLIIGLNGYIWVGEYVEAKDNAMEIDTSNVTPLHIRQNICRVANCIRVLSILGFSVSTEIIQKVFEWSVAMNLDIHDMLGAEFCVLVAEKEAERRSKTTKKKG